MDTAGSAVPAWARLDSPLLREMQAAIIVTDLGGVIRSCNPYAEVFFGRSASELIGHDSAEFAANPISSDLAVEIFEALKADRPGRASSRFGARTARSCQLTSSIPRCTTDVESSSGSRRCRSM